MKKLNTLITTLLFTVLVVLTNCSFNAQENLNKKKMKDWRSASYEAKLNTCMDFIKIWKEQHGEQITAEAQKEDAIKLVNCLDQGIKELPASMIDTMTIAHCGVSCCQYTIYGSIK